MSTWEESRRSPAFPGPGRAGRQIRVLAAILSLLALAVYSPVARNGFVTLDDDKGIYDNPQIRRGLTGETVRWALTTTEDASWYPLRRLSHLVDVSLFGMSAGAQHLVSAVWHGAAAGLLFAALRAMTGALWPSLLAASLFALHPLQVESVAWAIERSSVMSGAFFALALLLWVRHARRPGPGRYAAALLAYAGGLAAKPNLMTFPFLLLVLDFWPLGRLGRPGRPPLQVDPGAAARRAREKVPFLALAAAAGGLAVVAHQRAEALSSLASLPLSTRFANAAVSVWRYVGKIFWPVDLAAYYPYALADLTPGRALAAGALLAGATALAFALRRTRPWLALGWLWFLGMLAPMLGIVQFGAHAMADRFAYLAAVGVFVALAWSLVAPRPAGGGGRAVAAAVAAALLLGCAVLTVRQVGRWRDSVTLYEHTLAVTRDNWKIEFNLANELRRRGRREEALERYFRAARIQPEPDVLNNLGAMLLLAGRDGEALPYLREAVRTAPRSGEFRENLGLALERLGRREEAARVRREAAQLREGN